MNLNCGAKPKRGTGGISKDEFVKVMLEEKLVSQNNEQRRELAAKARIIATDLPVKDRSREYEWLAKNRDKYDGQYVVLDGDNLVAVGDGYRAYSKSAEKKF